MINYDRMLRIGVWGLTSVSILFKVFFYKKIFKLKNLTFSALERQIEAQLAEHRRSLESETEKFAIKERSNNNRLSEVELELTRLNGELRLETYS